MRGEVLLIALSVALSVAQSAAAQTADSDREAARALANAGLELYESGKFREAIERFGDAERIVHAPPHVLFIARSQHKLGRWVEARATYRSLVEERLGSEAPPAFREAQRTASTELAELEAKLPSLRIAVTGASDSLPVGTLDGQRVEIDAAIPIDPGDHKLVVEAEGYRRISKNVQASEGAGVIEVAVALLPLGDDAEPERVDAPFATWRIPGIALIGGGVVSLGVGAATGALALEKAGELRGLCPSNPCPTANEALADEANALATASTVTIILGGALAAGGVVWLVLGEPNDAAVTIGPSDVALRSSF